MNDLQSLSLGSITGIIAATFVVMEVLKRIFSTNTYFGKVPAWCYSVVVAMALCFVANKVLNNSDGTPMLPGQLTPLLWRACLAAASASGFYSWIGNTSIADAQPLQAVVKPPDPVPIQVATKPVVITPASAKIIPPNH